MKLVIDVPDWAAERHIRVFAGYELLAAKMAGNDFLLVKAVRCNKCGKCCRNIPETERRFPITDGVCDYLTEYTDGTTDCSRGMDMPFSCACANPVLHQWKGDHGCCIEFRRESIVNN